MAGRDGGVRKRKRVFDWRFHVGVRLWHIRPNANEKRTLCLSFQFASVRLDVCVGRNSLLNVSVVTIMSGRFL